MSEPSRKTHVIPSNTAAPEAPLAEVRVAKDRLIVTVPMAETRLADAVLFVTRSTMTVRSIPGRGSLQLTYPLPVEAEPGAFVARERNGVWDIAILRVSKKSI